MKWNNQINILTIHLRGPPAASDGASFMNKSKATNQAIFNEYQHHLGDNSFLFMNEARRGKNEKKERT